MTSHQQTSTHLVIQMLNAFEIDTTHLVVGRLPLQLQVVLKVLNDPTHNRLVSQPSHISASSTISHSDTAVNRCLIHKTHTDNIHIPFYRPLSF